MLSSTLLLIIGAMVGATRVDGDAHLEKAEEYIMGFHNETLNDDPYGVSNQTSVSSNETMEISGYEMGDPVTISPLPSSSSSLPSSSSATPQSSTIPSILPSLSSVYSEISANSTEITEQKKEKTEPTPPPIVVVDGESGSRESVFIQTTESPSRFSPGTEPEAPGMQPDYGSIPSISPHSYTTSEPQMTIGVEFVGGYSQQNISAEIGYQSGYGKSSETPQRWSISQSNSTESAEISTTTPFRPETTSSIISTTISTISTTVEATTTTETNAETSTTAETEETTETAQDITKAETTTAELTTEIPTTIETIAETTEKTEAATATTVSQNSSTPLAAVAASGYDVVSSSTVTLSPTSVTPTTSASSVAAASGYDSADSFGHSSSSVSPPPSSSSSSSPSPTTTTPPTTTTVTATESTAPEATSSTTEATTEQKTTTESITTTAATTPTETTSKRPKATTQKENIEPSELTASPSSPPAISRVISAQEAVGYDGIAAPRENTLRDLELPNAEMMKLPLLRIDSGTRQKWRPYQMDCSREEDDRGEAMCREWARGGLCDVHRATMFLFCRRTCLCVGPPNAEVEESVA